MPGATQAVNLVLQSPDDRPLTVGDLTLRLESVRAPLADAAHPCSLADFSVVQFSGPLGFEVAESTTATLGELAIPRKHWPRIGMKNTNLNQDGCKDAKLTFAFEASDAAHTG